MPASLGDNVDTSPRLARILKVGEIVNQLVGVGKAFAAKFFPGAGSDPVDFEALPELLGRVTTAYDGQLRSAARGGAKVALALTAAWYPEGNIRQVTEFMPTEDENGQPIVLSKVLAAVQGYATRVANMVDIQKFHKEYPDPHAATAESSLVNVGIAGDGEGEALAHERSLQDGGASPKDAGVSPQDLQTASTRTATP